MLQIFGREQHLVTDGKHTVVIMLNDELFVK